MIFLLFLRRSLYADRVVVGKDNASNSVSSSAINKPVSMICCSFPATLLQRLLKRRVPVGALANRLKSVNFGV
jgi:hypothetical protein